MAALDENRDWHWQGRILTRQGELRWADIKASARCFEDGRAVWDGVVWDITANKQIELELGESRAQAPRAVGAPGVGAGGGEGAYRPRGP